MSRRARISAAAAGQSESLPPGCVPKCHAPPAIGADGPLAQSVEIVVKNQVKSVAATLNQPGRSCQDVPLWMQHRKSVKALEHLRNCCTDATERLELTKELWKMRRRNRRLKKTEQLLRWSQLEEYGWKWQLPKYTGKRRQHIQSFQVAVGPTAESFLVDRWQEATSAFFDHQQGLPGIVNHAALALHQGFVPERDLSLHPGI